MSARTPLVRGCRVAVALSSVALLLVACGDDAPQTEPPPTASESVSGDLPADGESADAGDADTGDGATVADGATAPNGEVVDVVALDNTFRGETTEVVAGTAIHWENRGRNEHDVLPVDDAQSWGVDKEAFAPGDQYTLLFDQPGEYPYYCSIHGTKEVGMVGTIVVLPADA